MGSLNGACSHFAKSQVFHLALLDKTRHRAHHLLNGYRGVKPMLVKHINVVRPQPLQRFIDDFLKIADGAIHANDLVVNDAETELGSDHYLLTPPGKSAL